MRRARVHHSPEYETLLSRYLYKSAVTTLRPASHTDTAVISRDVIRPHNHPAAVAVGDGIGIDADTLTDIGAEGVLHVRVFPLEIATHQNRAAASITRCVEIRPGEQTHLVAQHLDAAACLAGVLAGGIERTGHTDDAFVATTQPDRAVDAGDRLRPDHACVVDHGRSQVPFGPGSQDHRAAVSLDQVPVLHQGTQG